jgi:hypothetical protein
MKRSIVMTLVVGVGLILFGCSEKNPTSPESSQPAAPLEKVVTYFTGTSVNIGALDPGKTVALPGGKVLIRGLVVQTEDVLSDSRVSGVVTWVVNLDILAPDNDTRWGSGELIIANVGKWDMTYKGYRTPEEGVRYEVDGHGKDGLTGLKAHWTYLLPNPPGVFDVQGFIVEQ